MNDGEWTEIMKNMVWKINGDTQNGNFQNQNNQTLAQKLNSAHKKNEKIIKRNSLEKLIYEYFSIDRKHTYKH